MAVSGEPSTPSGDLSVIGPRKTSAASGMRWELAGNARACGLTGYEHGEYKGQGPNSVADPTGGRRCAAPSGPGEGVGGKVAFAPRRRRFRGPSFNDEAVQGRRRDGRYQPSGLPAGSRRGVRRSAHRRTR